MPAYNAARTLEKTHAEVMEQAGIARPHLSGEDIAHLLDRPAEEIRGEEDVLRLAAWYAFGSMRDGPLASS